MLRMNNKCLLTDPRMYHQRDAIMGDTLMLWCNTTESSGVVWTWKTKHENITYVSVNGSITGRPRPLLEFSVVNTSKGEYSLMIYNVHPADSGLFDCYETDGRRIVGYQLVAKSKLLSIL